MYDTFSQADKKPARKKTIERVALINILTNEIHSDLNNTGM